MQMKEYKTIDEYISNFPPEVQQKLQKIRQVIKQVLPDSTEKISYGIPTFWQKRNVVHFGAYPKHIGFYPGSSAIVEFAHELEAYVTSKGTVQFPLDKPIPYELIELMTKFNADKISKN